MLSGHDFMKIENTLLAIAILAIMFLIFGCSTPIYGKFYNAEGAQLGFCTEEKQGGYMNPSKIEYFDMKMQKIAECTDAENNGGFKGGCSDQEYVAYGPCGPRCGDDANRLISQGIKYRCIAQQG